MKFLSALNFGALHANISFMEVQQTLFPCLYIKRRALSSHVNGTVTLFSTLYIFL